MTSNNNRTRTTALAVAIATALVAAPIAYSAGKKPTTLAKARDAVDISKAPAQENFDSFIVSFKKGIKPNARALRQSLDAAGRNLGVKIAAKRVMGTGAQVISIDRALDSAEHKRLVVELSKNPAVRAVEPNGRMYRMFTPNDPMYAQQWHYQDAPMGINVEDAWDDYDGTGINIAVVDTGMRTHEDLPVFVPGYDMISDPTIANDGDGRDSDSTDPGDFDDKYASSWHGTHVAGTIAAVTDNAIGVAGVAHGASVQHVRVLGVGGGTYEDVADGLIWAAGGEVSGAPLNPNPADVINVSLGGGGACLELMQDAIDIVNDLGAIVVVAAGNAGGDVANYQPASCDGVITVAGTGPNNTKYASTNFGEEIEVAAPAGSGVNPAENQVLSTVNLGETVPAGDGYAWYAGTSMATPHVVGTVALMLEAAGGPGSLSLDEATEILVNTGYATNNFVTGCNTTSMWCASLIDATYATAVAAEEEPLPPTPPGPPPPPPPTEIEEGVTVELPDMAPGTDLFFVLDVPEGATNLNFALVPATGATGDSDLYVRFGEPPTDGDYDCRPFTGGVVAENCPYPTPEAGEYHVRVDAWSASAGWTLTATYDIDVPTEGPANLEARHVFPLKGSRIRVLLGWDEADNGQVEIRHEGEVVATVDDNGYYTHTFTADGPGAGSTTYEVCYAGTEDCSEITVNYVARR